LLNPNTNWLVPYDPRPRHPLPLCPGQGQGVRQPDASDYALSITEEKVLQDLSSSVSDCGTCHFFRVTGPTETRVSRDKRRALTIAPVELGPEGGGYQAPGGIRACRQEEPSRFSRPLAIRPRWAVMPGQSSDRVPAGFLRALPAHPLCRLGPVLHWARHAKFRGGPVFVASGPHRFRPAPVPLPVTFVALYGQQLTHGPAEL